MATKFVWAADGSCCSLRGTGPRTPNRRHRRATRKAIAPGGVFKNSCALSRNAWQFEGQRRRGRRRQGRSPPLAGRTVNPFTARRGRPHGKKKITNPKEEGPSVFFSDL